MKYEIRNIAKRPISIVCNTGETRHLPPNHVSEFIESEIISNGLVKKLEDRGLIHCSKVTDKKSVSAARKKTGDGGTSAKKKAQSK